MCAPAPQVEWEFWTNSNDMCGAVCDVQREFIKVSGGGRSLMHLFWCLAEARCTAHAGGLNAYLPASCSERKASSYWLHLGAATMQQRLLCCARGW